MQVKFNGCKRMAKTAALSVRLTDEVKQALERAAAADSRSTASLAEKVLTQWLREQKYLPAT